MTLYDKIDTIDEQALAGKKALADALLQVGITAVEPNPNNPDSYETFQSYADKIKRLMISNSLILEYHFPENGFEQLTKYKRTLMLPMSGVPINDIAISIINSDTGYTSATTRTLAIEDNAPSLDELNGLTDHLGNKCADSMPEQPEWHDPEYVQCLMDEAGTPSTLTLEDMYSFTVDWGDGSPAQEFISLEETPTSWYHEYTAPGTYDVTINGVFAQIRNVPNWNGLLIVDGQPIYDKDGRNVFSGYNYLTTNRLTKIIAWGNTRLTSLSRCLQGCFSIVSIPTYDTTASFQNVTTAYMFARSSELPALPYDSGAERGLFSNCPLITSFQYAFDLCEALNEQLPALMIDNCSATTIISNMFNGCSGLTSTVPANMFKGLPNLLSASSVFRGTDMSGQVPQGLFDDCPNLSNYALMFANTSVSGVIPPALFASTTVMSVGMFRDTDIIGVDADFLSGHPSGRVFQTYAMFDSCASLTQPIASGTFDTVPTGNLSNMFRMFSYCDIASVPQSILTELAGREDCRCMFAMNKNMTGTVVIPSVPDKETLRPYLGIFAGNTSLDNYASVPRELGGNGLRLFPDDHVGMILMADGTFVEIGDFAYDPDNLPVGWCFYSDETGDRVCALNDAAAQVIDNIALSGETEWLPTYDGPQGYDRDLYSMTPANGMEICQSIVDTPEYAGLKERMPCFKLMEEHSFGIPGVTSYIPSVTELATIAVLSPWLQHACDTIVAAASGNSSLTSDYVYSLDKYDISPSSGAYVSSCQFSPTNLSYSFSWRCDACALNLIGGYSTTFWRFCCVIPKTA